MMLGKIPETMVYFSRPGEDDKDLLGNTVRVLPTYPAYPESEARMKSGKEWAEGRSWRRKPQHDAEKPSEREAPNLFDGLQILSLEKRGEGGRAYKVIAGPERMLFDLRETTLLDIMRHVGIQPNGVIPGEFVWAVQGSQLNLIRKNGAEYLALTAAQQDFDAKKKAGVKDLEVGRIYTNKSGEKYVFLGAFYTQEYILSGGEQRYTGYPYYTRAQPRPSMTEPAPRSKVERYFFWYRVPGWKDAETTLESLLLENRWYLERTKNPGVRYVTDETLPWVEALGAEGFLRAAQDVLAGRGNEYTTYAELLAATTSKP